MGLPFEMPSLPKQLLCGVIRFVQEQLPKEMCVVCRPSINVLEYDDHMRLFGIAIV